MHRTLSALAIFLAGLASNASAETIVLTFPLAGTCAADASGTTVALLCTDGMRIYQGYGDTANVDFTYIDVAGNPPHSLFFWSSLYSGLSSIAWANKDSRIDIAPTANAPVTLDSLDIGVCSTSRSPSPSGCSISPPQPNSTIPAYSPSEQLPPISPPVCPHRTDSP